MTTTEQREQVDVLLPGGIVSIDVTACIADGIIDSDDAETTGDVLIAVKKLIDTETSLVTPEGGRVLITVRQSALTYRRLK